MTFEDRQRRLEAYWKNRNHVKTMRVSDLSIDIVCGESGESIIGSDIDRFKHRLYKLTEKKNHCWEYQGGFSGDGYGKITIKKKQYRANRLSYFVSKGPISKGLFVCHSCDNPKCINPGHLFLGTPKDNMQDMIRKGRHNHPSGYLNPSSKLTKKEVEQIRTDYTPGHKSRPNNNNDIKGLAKKYNLSYSTVFKIVNNLSYRDSNEQN